MINNLELNSKAQELRTKLGVDSNSPIDIFKICDLVEDFLKNDGFYDEFQQEFILFKIKF